MFIVFCRSALFVLTLIFCTIHLVAQSTTIRAAGTTATLQSAWTGLAGHTIYQLTTSATRVNTTLRMSVFAATNKGLYRSLDSGRTWNILGVPNDDVYDMALITEDASTLILASDKGVQRSSNSGASWQVMTFPITIVTTASSSSTRSTVQYSTQQRALPTYALQSLKNGSTTILFAGTSRSILMALPGAVAVRSAAQRWQQKLFVHSLRLATPSTPQCGMMAFTVLRIMALRGRRLILFPDRIPKRPSVF
jgi:ligand-binding sensor domain-containing protein